MDDLHLTRRRRMTGCALVTLAVLIPTVVGVPPAAAYPRPGGTERIPDRNNGGIHASVSDDGRLVAFQTRSKLVTEDTNGASDVYVHDVQAGTTRLVSVASDGMPGNDDSGEASISADGRHVVFWSEAPNLVPSDDNEATDVLVHDLETGITDRVSVATDGAEGSGAASRSNSDISADGRFVAFSSAASNLVPDDTNSQADVFVHDRATGVTERVSIASDGTQGTSGSFYPSISADGLHVAFFSFAAGLVPEDANASNDIFVHDRETGTTERVSIASDGTEGNSHAFRDPSISADGRYVAFSGVATNLVPGDANGAEDVFVHDRETGKTERVSVSSDGAEGDGSSLVPSISADGRYVTFHGIATNLVPGDTNGLADTFVHDRATGITERVSIASDGAEGDGNSHGWPAVSADGGLVAFHSIATNLVPGDTNGEFGFDMFVRHRGSAVDVVHLAATPGETGIDVAGSITASGRVLSAAPDPADDGLPGAEAAGAELTGATLVHRPEHEDLLVRLNLTSMPGLAPGACAEGVCAATSTGGGAPAVVYQLGFDIGQVRYEVRAIRVGASGVPASTPAFLLYRCEIVCQQHAVLGGGFGTTGAEVRVGVPLDLLGVSAEASLDDIRASVGPGEAASGPLVVLDEADLPDAALAPPRLWLGAATKGTPEAEVPFDTEVAIVDGHFSGKLEVPAGQWDVWARTCLGEVCGAAWKPVTLG